MAGRLVAALNARPDSLAAWVGYASCGRNRNAGRLQRRGRAPIGLRGRRIAVLGDMLELGPSGGQLHASLAEAVRNNAIDTVFCCGPLMRHLWDALPSGRRGGYAATSAELESAVLGAIHGGDAVMVKGSFGSKMKLIVTGLERRFPYRNALDDAAV